MGYCPVCGELEAAAACKYHPETVTSRCCVICAKPVCERCRHGPRHTALCPDHAGVSVIEGWAEVWRTADEVEAEMVASLLRGPEIEAHVLSQKDSANVVSFGGLSIVRVLVPAHLHRRAISVLRAEGLADIG